MQKTVYQTPELRDSNDNIIQQGAFGKNTALSNATNDGWIDYVVNNLEALHDTVGDSAATLDGNGHVVEPCNLAIGDEDGNRLKTSYLKLTGGTMTGALNARLNLKMQDSQENVIGGLIVPDSSASDQYLRMYGGSAHDAGGAQLTLKQNGDGRFYLTAKSTDGSQTYDLRGDSNGSLYWRGWNVITSAGGTLNGQLVINRANSNTGGGIKLTGAGQNYAISALNTNVTKGTAPSSNQYWGIDFYGKDVASYNQRIGMLETTLNTNNVATTAISAYNCTTNTNNNTCRISVNVDENGNAYTYAPTPANGDNSTKIATTAFVNTKAGYYLPLSGGTLTGDNAKITVGNGNSFISSYSMGIYMSGDSDTSNASFFQLYTKSNGNGFYIDAGNGSTRKRLQGKPDGTLTWDGLDISPQSCSESQSSQDVTLANGTPATVHSFSLTKGTWLLLGRVYFASNANGYRAVWFSSSSGGSSINSQTRKTVTPPSGAACWTQVMAIRSISTTTTLYLVASQNSGSSLNASGGVVMFRLSNRA